MVLTVIATLATYHFQQLGLFGARYQFSFEDVMSADRVLPVAGLSGLMFLLIYGILLREFDSKFSALLQMRNEILLETFSIGSGALLEQASSTLRARYFLFADLCVGYHMTRNRAFTTIFLESIAVVFDTCLKNKVTAQNFLNRTSFLADFLATEETNRQLWLRRFLAAHEKDDSTSSGTRKLDSSLDQAS